MLRPHLRLPLVLSAMLAMLPGIAPGITRAETIAYWRFENGAANTVATGAGSILDLSGHGLNGTPVGNTVYRTDVPVNPVPATGAANTRSLDFDVSGSRVAVADNPLLALTKSMTLEAFIRPRATGDFIREIIFRGDDLGGLDPYRLTLSQNLLGFVIMNNNVNADSLVYSIPSFDTWIHVAGTLDDATGAMNLYINGVSVASKTTSVRPLGTLFGPNPGLGIGNVQSANYPQAFNGLIDEVRISDVALQPGQFLNASAVPGIDPAGMTSALALLIGAVGLVERRRRDRT